MRDGKAHIAQAQSNEDLAKFLENTAYRDWRATSLFYAALHYVQAYFVDNGRSPSRHSDREEEIHLDKRISAIWNDYRSLKDWSTRARYNGQKPSDSEFKVEIVPSLEAVKKHLRSLIDLR